MWPRSLGGRLLLTSAAWSIFALAATAFILSAAFRDIIERRFDETLTAYLTILVGQLDMVDGDLFIANIDAGDPRFELPFSGFYWTMQTIGGEDVVASNSLLGDSLDTPPGFGAVRIGVIDRAYAPGPAEEEVRLMAQTIVLEDGTPIRVTLAGDAASIAADTADFVRQLSLFLGGFALVLVIATFIQWRVSMRPLQRLGAELEAVRDGHARHVSEDLPLELAPLAAALNTLVRANAATLERARRHVGNLAHALKTPISVLRNDAEGADTPLARSVSEQTAAMQRQVRFYLDRAQMAAREPTVGTVTETRPVLAAIQRVMTKLSADRGIEIVVDDEPCRFLGERQDFEEIVGNLIDNAVKWTTSTVHVSLHRSAVEKRERVRLVLVVEDDGPGLSEAEREAVIQRGKRLDEAAPGSGLGLSIVDELVELYRGTLDLSESPLGGLRVTVELPAL